MNSFYRDMDADELESQYNVRARRGDEFIKVVEDWRKRSEHTRAHNNMIANLSYGNGEREKLDWFYSGNARGPVLLYLHGGYWQSGDKGMYSFLADGFVRSGISVGVVNYDLAPVVKIGQITTQIRKAISWIWHSANELGFDRDQLFICGHSAGGHLTAMMMCSDWPELDLQLPRELIKGGIPISGLFELEPLIHTTINNSLKMGVTEARSQSPCFTPLATNAPQLIVVGGGETPEFFRQADDYAARNRTVDRAIERLNSAQDDHFDVVASLANEKSALFRAVAEFVLK